VTEKDLWNDLQPLLDHALSGLPDKYRVALVLCDLEGKTRKEAARQLGVPEGTLAARLSRGRKMLGQRLARQGLALSGASLAVVLAQNAASASVPSGVVSSTIKAASLFAVEQAAVASAISVKAVALAEGVIKTMFLAKVKIATTLVLGMGLLGISWGLYSTQAAALPEAKPETAPPPPSAFAAPDKEGGKLAKDGPGQHKIGLPKGPAPFQVLVSVTKDGKLMVKSEHFLITKKAIRVPPLSGNLPHGSSIVIQRIGEGLGPSQPPGTIELSYDLKDVQVFDTKGKKIGMTDLPKLLKDDTLAVESYGEVDPLHLRILKDGTLVFLLPRAKADEMPFPAGGDHALLPDLGPKPAAIFFIRTGQSGLESNEQRWRYCDD
jgi:hypothetical protein